MGISLILTTGIGIVLAVVRLIESVLELSKTPEVETIWGKIKQIAKNFLAIETYPQSSGG